LTIVNAFQRGDMLDEMDRLDAGITMSKSTHPPPCPECGKPMRFIVAEPVERKFRCVAYGSDDPLRWPKVWDLFNGELQPPRTAHYELGVARSEP
jgi:hypothetical protein